MMAGYSSQVNKQTKPYTEAFRNKEVGAIHMKAIVWKLEQLEQQN